MLLECSEAREPLSLRGASARVDLRDDDARECTEDRLWERIGASGVSDSQLVFLVAPVTWADMGRSEPPDDFIGGAGVSERLTEANEVDDLIGFSKVFDASAAAGSSDCLKISRLNTEDFSSSDSSAFSRKALALTAFESLDEDDLACC